MRATRNIVNELKSIKQDKNSGLTLELVSESDTTHLRGTFIGPPDTPYEGGKFVVEVNLPPEYPFKAPSMRFETKIYHPNISSVTGAICLDILKDEWLPVMTLQSSLISLQALLQSPEPNDPQDAVVANKYLNDFEGFQKIAKEWTETYATGEEDEYEGIEPECVQRFEDMGFGRAQVVAALKKLEILRKDQLDPDVEVTVVEKLC